MAPKASQRRNNHPFSSILRTHYLWHLASSFDHTTNTLKGKGAYSAQKLTKAYGKVSKSRWPTVLIRRKLNIPPLDAWHSSGRYKSLVTWSQKYPSWFKLGSQICILFLRKRLSRHLALAPMSHQKIRQSEPFQGAPEPGFYIANNEFSRQDITSIYFMPHLYFLLRLFWIIVMVCIS